MWYYIEWILGYFLKRLEWVSDTSKEIAQVFFAVIAVESFVQNRVNLGGAFLGLLAAMIFWLVSVISFRIK
jgi:hypothetical protein